MVVVIVVALLGWLGFGKDHCDPPVGVGEMVGIRGGVGWIAGPDDEGGEPRSNRLANCAELGWFWLLPGGGGISTPGVVASPGDGAGAVEPEPLSKSIEPISEFIPWPLFVFREVGRLPGGGGSNGVIGTLPADGVDGLLLRGLL